MKKPLTITTYTNQFLPPLYWLVTVGFILILAIWMPLSISKLNHWEGNNFLFHGGIWGVTILILNAGMKFCGTQVADLQIRPIHPFIIPLVLIVTIAFGFLTEPLSSLQPIELKGDHMHPFGLMPSPLTFVLFVILLPLIEEFFFRGLLLGHMLHKLNVSKAIVISSFLYSLAQWGNEHLLTALLFGLLAGLLFVVTRSLLSSILFHIAWNFFIFYSWLDDYLMVVAGMKQVPDLNGWLLLKEVAIVTGIIGVFYLMHRIAIHLRRFKSEEILKSY